MHTACLPEAIWPPIARGARSCTAHALTGQRRSGPAGAVQREGVADDRLVHWLHTGVPQLELGLLVTNVDNVQAPFDANRVPHTYSAYQSAMHSAVGRFLKLTAKYTFR